MSLSRSLTADVYKGVRPVRAPKPMSLTARERSLVDSLLAQYGQRYELDHGHRPSPQQLVRLRLYAWQDAKRIMREHS